MKTMMTLVLVAGLAGCAAQRPVAVNYGHPALNNAVAAQVQPMPVPPSNDPGRVAVGTILGGVVGSQFGQGDGRLVGAAVGAAAGAMTAQGGYSNEAALGAIAGGAIGSRFGAGEGRTAATAIGAGLGAWLAVPNR